MTEIAAMKDRLCSPGIFLTAIPISRTHHVPTVHGVGVIPMAWYSPSDSRSAAWWRWPMLALRSWMAAEVGNALLIVLLVLLTRGLHQDGLADTVDGLAGGRNR